MDKNNDLVLDFEKDDINAKLNEITRKGIKDIYVKNLSFVSKQYFNDFFNKNCDLSRIESITFLTPVKEVGESAFRESKNLKKVVFEEGVEKISDFAFFKCEKLETVAGLNLEKNLENLQVAELESIDDFAFYQCKRLKNLRFGPKLKKIGSWALAFCYDLGIVKIPESVEKLGSGICSGCINLEILALPSNVKSIPNYLCQDCFKLKDLITFKEDNNREKIPARLENIEEVGENAFARCSCLTSLPFKIDNAKLGKGAFRETALKILKLPDSLETIPADLCSGCHDLIFVEGKNVKNIQSRAFTSCRNLKKISFPSLETIGTYAFKECKSLTQLVFPKSMKLIKGLAFKDCPIKSIILSSYINMAFHIFDEMVIDTYIDSSQSKLIEKYKKKLKEYKYSYELEFIEVPFPKVRCDETSGLYSIYNEDEDGIKVIKEDIDLSDIKETYYSLLADDVENKAIDIKIKKLDIFKKS